MARIRLIEGTTCEHAHGRHDLARRFSDHLKLQRMAPSSEAKGHEKTRSTEEQMVTILREVDDKSVLEVAK